MRLLGWVYHFSLLICYPCSSYMSLVVIHAFNALIDNKPFFDQPVKNKPEVYEKLVEMSRNSDYTTGNLLDYLCNQKF